MHKKYPRVGHDICTLLILWR